MTISGNSLSNIGNSGTTNQEVIVVEFSDTTNSTVAITNNIIDTLRTSASNANNEAIYLFVEDSGDSPTVSYDISGNTISNVNGEAIVVGNISTAIGSATMSGSIHDNSGFTSNSISDVLVHNNDASSSLCADIYNNTFTGSTSTNQIEIALDLGTLNLEDHNNFGTSVTITQLLGNNTNTDFGTPTVTGSPSVVAQGTCASPNASPVITSIADQNTDKATVLTNVAAFTATDTEDGNIAVGSISITSSDQTVVANSGITLNDLGSGSYDLGITPAGLAGTATITVTATDSGSAVGMQTFDVVVADNSPGLTVTVEQKAGQDDPTNTLPIEFTITFSDPINTGTFDTTDIVQNGTASNAGLTWMLSNGGDDKIFTASVTASTVEGTIVPSINASTVQDLAGDNNDASTSSDHSVTYDVTSPTVTINQAVGQLDPGTTLPINFAVVFSEEIDSSSFTAADITHAGSASGVEYAVTSSGDNINFTVKVTAVVFEGTIEPSIAAGKIQDAAGNDSALATSTDGSVTFDSDDLTVAISQQAGQVGSDQCLANSF